MRPALSGQVEWKKMVHGPLPFTHRIGGTKRFCDISLGGSNSLAGRLAGNEAREQGARESATRSVGRLGDDPFSFQPAPLPRGSEQEIVGPAEVATGDHHVQLIVAQPHRHLAQTSGSRRHLFPADGPGG